MCEDELARAFRGGHGEEDDEEDDYGCTGPVDTEGVNLVEILGEEHIDQVAH